MNIALTWDLFVLVFFGIILAYSFIIGQNATLKVILGTYVAALAADAGGNLFVKYLGNSKPFLKAFTGLGVQGSVDAGIFIKVALFILFVIILTIRGGIHVDLKPGKSMFTRLVLTAIFGFLSAGLIVSTVLMYVSGLSFIAGGASAGQSSILGFSGNSPFVQQLLTYYNLWFLMPVIVILVREFLAGKDA